MQEISPGTIEKLLQKDESGILLILLLTRVLYINYYPLLVLRLMSIIDAVLGETRMPSNI